MIVYICTLNIHMRDDVRGIVEDIKVFVKEHILTGRGSIFLAQAEALEAQGCQHKNSCCLACFDDQELYELDYYLQLLRIIKARLKRAASNSSSCDSNICTTYDFRSGVPVVVYETRFTGVMKFLIFLFMAIAGLTQFIRGQIDGELSAWSQIGFIAGAIISISYFYNTKQYSFIVPQLGSLVISSLQLAALARHRGDSDIFADW